MELNPSMLTSIPGLIGLVFLMLLASTETNGGNNKQFRLEFNDTETMLQEVNNIATVSKRMDKVGLGHPGSGTYGLQ